MALTFAFATGLNLLNACFCLGDWFSKLWLCPAFRRRSFPVEDTLNFFFAPELVFIFGIFFDPRVSGRSQHHRHVATLEERLGLDRPELLHLFCEPHEQVTAAIRMLAL